MSLLSFLVPGPLPPSLPTILFSITPLFLHALLTHFALRDNTWLLRLSIAPVQAWILWRLMGGVEFSDPLLFWMNNIVGTLWMILLILLPRSLLPRPYRFKRSYTGPSYISAFQFIFNPLGDYFVPRPPYFVPSNPYSPSSLPSQLAWISPLVQCVLCHIPPAIFLAATAVCIPNIYEDSSILDAKWLGLGAAFTAGMTAWCLLTGFWCLNNWFQQSTEDRNVQPRGNLMNSPWRSTSVHEFWRCRWHTLFLPIILFYKALLLPSEDHQSGIGKQLSKLVTPFLGFFLTAICHENLIYPMANTNRPRLGYISLFFLLQPIALLLERAFLHLSGGRKVSGPVGWVWTFVWLGFTGRYLAEGYVRMGVLRQLKAIYERFRCH